MIRIAVAALTCRRPNMLGRLLASFEGVREPEGAELTFLIVDNAPDMPAEAAVAAWAERSGRRSLYVIEAEPGIPYARNRALDEAAARNFDLLAFIDDDETADPDWIASLLARRRATGAELVGGPVRAEKPEGALGLSDRLVYHGVEGRYLRKERKNARRAAAGTDSGVTIITNNWLGDVAWLKRSGVRFDVALRYTGGSDTALYHAARKAGAKTAWAPAAIVYETIPRDRIGLGYQYARARDQAATSFLRKQADERRGLPASLAAIVGKFVVGAGLLAAAPFTGGRTLVDSARSFGWGMGYVNALRGRKSRHYEALQGD